MSWPVEAILAGQAKPFRGDEKSAFVKEPLNGTVHIGIEGIAGDEQADRVHHGGPHMAVHLYPLAHHAFWQEKLGGHDLLKLPGAFGTNLSVPGITEQDAYLGDRFRLGTALLEISQPRKPCWKIEHRFQKKGMVSAIIKAGRSGWYFRVIESGEAQAGDQLEPVTTRRTEWTVARIFAAILNPKSNVTEEELIEMGDCPLLSPDWRDGAQQKATQLAG